MGTLSERIGRSYDTLQAMLSPPEASRGSAAFTIKNGLYINFLVEMPYLDPLLFQLARDDNDASLPCAVPGSAAIRELALCQSIQRLEEGVCDDDLVPSPRRR